MPRAEGTVDTVELKRNQSCSQALSRMRVAKRKEHHAELRKALGTLTPEIPLRLHRALRGHRARLLPVLNRTRDNAF